MTALPSTTPLPTQSSGQGIAPTPTGTPSFFQRVFPLDHYANPLDRDRARAIYRICVILMLGFTVFFALKSPTGPVPTLFTLGDDLLSLLSYAGVMVGGAATIWLTRSGQLALASTLTPVLWLVSGVALGFRDSFYLPSSAIAPAILILIGALTNGVRGWLISTVVAFAVIFASLLLPNNSDVAGRIQPTFILGYVSQVLGASLAIRLFLRSATLERAVGYEQAIEQRLNLASITSQIAQRISARLNIEQVLNTAVEEIRESYPDIYHAQIFLIGDNGLDAWLVASTGEVGQLLLQRRHSLPVASQSVIGQVTGNGQPVIARAGAADGIHRPNPLLPDTQVEAAFPLKLGDQVIGALDLQTRNLEAFRPEEVPIFESLAGNIAVAIDNARLLENATAQAGENQRLAEEARRAAAEAERLNAALTRRAWAEYAGDRAGQLNREVNLHTGAARPLDSSARSIAPAAQAGHVVQTPFREYGDEGITVSVPMQVRGQVVGVLEFDVPGTDPLDEADLALIDEVAERLAIAAENTRLYEEAQTLTAQEQRVNTISQRYQQVTSVEELLEVTVHELSEALGAKRGAIRLGRSDIEATDTMMLGADVRSDGRLEKMSEALNRARSSTNSGSSSNSPGQPQKAGE